MRCAVIVLFPFLLATETALWGAGSIKTQPESIDLGQCELLSAPRANFKVTNTGKSAIPVWLSTTCGCTTAILAKDRLAPGETTSGTVTLSTAVGGAVEQTVNVHGPDVTEFVRLKADVVPAFKIEPQRVDIVLSSTEKKSLIANVRVSARSRIDGVTPQVDSDLITVKSTKKSSNDLELTLFKKPVMPIGSHNMEVALFSEGRVLATIPVMLQVVPPVECVPSEAAFGVFAKSETRTVSLLVKTKPKEQLMVAGLKLSNADLKLSTTVTPQGEHKLDFTLVPKQSGVISAEANVEYKALDGSVTNFSIPISAGLY